jgi:hypothetical protein
MLERVNSKGYKRVTFVDSEEVEMQPQHRLVTLDEPAQGSAVVGMLSLQQCSATPPSAVRACSPHAGCSVELETTHMSVLG